MTASPSELSEGSKNFEANLIEASEVFRSFTPEGMDFREPKTLIGYRGMFCKATENKWKALFGSEADADTAIVVLESLGLKPEPFAGPRGANCAMYGVAFDGQEGA